MKTEYYQFPVELMGKVVDSMDAKNPMVYGNYLAQTYYYVSHSTRMLALAAGLMKRNDESHFRRFVKHIGEEAAHEVLAEKDLQDLGMKPSDFGHLPETRALWEPQYYKIQHENPLSLMGYIIALESFATTQLPRFYQKVKEVYEGKACRFIKLHAEEDPEHIEKAIQLTSTLSNDLQETVVANVVQTAKSYVVMVEACVTSLSSSSQYSLGNVR
jgi:pyrroloquinoline quinone (PQQ) biosynthesis protein C